MLVASSWHRSACSSRIVFQGGTKRDGPSTGLSHSLFSRKEPIQESPLHCKRSCAAAVKGISKGSRASLNRDFFSIKTLPDLADYLQGEGSNASMSARKFCRFGLKQALYLVRGRQELTPRKPRLTATDRAAAVLVLQLAHERLPTAFASCSTAAEVSRLLKLCADMAWVSKEPLTTSARQALSDALQSAEVLEDLFGSSTDPSTTHSSSESSIALRPFLDCYAAASQAGLRPGPLPYSFLVHTLEHACKLPSEDERTSISRAVKAICDFDQESPPTPSAPQTKQQQQPQLYKQSDGGEAPSKDAAEDPDIATLRSVPLTTVPNVLRVLKGAKRAVRSEGSNTRKAARLQALAAVVAAALSEGGRLVKGQEAGRGGPSPGGAPDVECEEHQGAMLRYAADSLPHVTTSMCDDDLCKVVRVLSYWCEGRGSAGLSGGRAGAGAGFLQLIRPRLRTGKFLQAAAAQGVLPEVLAFCSACGESSSTVLPVLKVAAKHLSKWPEPHLSKAAAAVAVAGWDDESSAEIIEACFAKCGQDVVRADSRLAKLAMVLKEESSTEMCKPMFSGLAAAAAKQPAVDIKLGIAQFVGQMIEAEEASSQSFGETAPSWASRSGASSSLLRILRGVEASLVQPTAHLSPEYAVKSHQWVTIARLGAAAATNQASISDASRIVFKASGHLQAGTGLHKLDALELADLARSLLRLSISSNSSNSQQEAILTQVISAVNPKLELLGGDELAECAKRQVLPGEGLQKHAESFLCSTLREACAKLRDSSMGAKGLATLLEAVARLPLAERIR
ncbi:hypothetical protein DUNSADRAFT_4456 [Dunaliella salina]|uniref:Uncharacterized protein n=1 Tax=Dunaliella salina TaxID=3046 RepID=A0ABQ7GS57_DUNSA|nr:hypothetical protein DUNSADRAFT_4456 [Dunaliella salina]|eukprot:KAF5837408.1 hypothetical protein DUNSADRAFT_4456 [Dunaliella salina]